MAIIASELKLYQSAIVTNDTTNGGRLSSNEIVDGQANNLFPNITETQRLAGLSLTRKAFYKVANDADTVGNETKLYIQDITPAGTSAVLYAATQRDTAADLTGSERKYGAGRLNANVSSAATIIVVDAELNNGANLIFQAGDKIYITDGTNGEVATIAAGGVAWSVDQATLTLDAGLLNSYAVATPTTVSSCFEAGTVQATVDNWVETSTAGTYDETGSALVLDSIGSVEQTWTVTFSDATNFSVVGDTLGSVGSGTVGVDFTPSNPDFTKPYFTLLAAGFGGTWAVGETIVFQTHPAAVPIWCDLVVPVGTAGFGGDSIVIAMSVESA